jgi:hypothetical protein
MAPRFMAPTAATGLLVAQIALLAQPPADPFAFFRPSIHLSADEHQELSRGEALVRVLPARGHQVAVFAAVPVNVDGGRLISWVRNITALKKSAAVVSIGRFSEPPRIEDLAALAPDDADLEEIRRCRPGDCGVKLAAGEIERLRGAIAGVQAAWKPRLQDAFRDVVLQRVQTYLASGHAALPPYDDHDEPVRPEEVFSSVMRQSVSVTEHLPQFADYLERYPHAPVPAVESFIYWSKERLAGKPVISATHVSILRTSEAALPEALVAGTQIFATHYMNGALSLTAILRGRSGSQNYLAYLNRSEVDVVGGFLGRLVRSIIERRLKSEASELLQGVRRRLERGEPPA